MGYIERKNNRLKAYDYSRDNFYFITICVKDKEHKFGEVVDGIMYLNENGIIVDKQWEWLCNQYPYISSHAFVVMPNHIHAILEINAQKRTGRDLSLQGSDFAQIKTKSLSQLIGAYKTTSSKQIHQNNDKFFEWQRSFHDHIIRNDYSFKKIHDYIRDNTANWKDDCFNKDKTIT